MVRVGVVGRNAICGRGLIALPRCVSYQEGDSCRSLAGRLLARVRLPHRSPRLRQGVPHGVESAVPLRLLVMLLVVLSLLILVRLVLMVLLLVVMMRVLLVMLG